MISFWLLITCLSSSNLKIKAGSLWLIVIQMQVVPEPVDKWQDVGNGHHNVLEAFYNSPERFAYTFQNYVFVTRMMQVSCICLTLVQRFCQACSQSVCVSTIGRSLRAVC